MGTGSRPILQNISFVEKTLEIRELTHASHEQNHTANAEKATNKVDLLKDFCC
jgi:hypothetical protein